MRARRLEEADGRGDWLLAFQKDEPVVSLLKRFANERKITAAHFNAIGAFRKATLAYFDWEKKDYRENAVDEQVEVASLTGDIAMEDGDPAVHIHCVLGRRDGSALAGHLREARVRPTLELFLTEDPTEIRKHPDRETGLELFAPNEPEEGRGD